MGLVVKRYYFHLREMLTVESPSHRVRSGHGVWWKSPPSYLRLRWCPSSWGSYTPGSPQSTSQRLARSEERNKYHPGTAIVNTAVRNIIKSLGWAVHLIVNFNWLYVLPFLNGLGQVHHAERDLHLTDLTPRGSIPLKLTT